MTKQRITIMQVNGSPLWHAHAGGPAEYPWITACGIRGSEIDTRERFDIRFRCDECDRALRSQRRIVEQ